MYVSKQQFITLHGNNVFEEFPGIRITKKLGEGEYGKIYQVTLDKQKYAIKVETCPNCQSFEDFHQKKRTEIRAQIKLAKKGYALELYDHIMYEDEEGKPWSIVLMELMNPKTDMLFHTFMETQGIPDESFEYVEAKLLDTLKVACNLNVVHADMHFSNVFIRFSEPNTTPRSMTYEGTKIMLLDFGMSIATKCIPLLEIVALARASDGPYPEDNIYRFLVVIYNILQMYLKRTGDTKYDIPFASLQDGEVMDKMYIQMFKAIQKQFGRDEW